MYVIYIYITKDKEYEKTYFNLYNKFIPNNRSCETLGYLMNNKVTRKHFIACVIDLIRRKDIYVGTINNEIYLIDNKSNSDFLSKSDKFIKKFLFDNIGNGEYVSLTSIKNETKYNGGYFYSRLKEWYELVKIDCARYNFFESKDDFIQKVFLYFSISFLLAVYNLFITHYILLSIIIMLLIIVFLIYISSFYKRTKESSREYEEWVSFKNYLDNSNYLKKEKYDSNTIGLICVYSIVLKSFDKFNNIFVENDKNLFLKLYKLGLISRIVKELNNYLTYASFFNISFTYNKGNNTLRRSTFNDKIKVIKE